MTMVMVTPIIRKTKRIPHPLLSAFVTPFPAMAAPAEPSDHDTDTDSSDSGAGASSLSSDPVPGEHDEHCQALTSLPCPPVLSQLETDPEPGKKPRRLLKRKTTDAADNAPWLQLELA